MALNERNGGMEIGVREIRKTYYLNDYWPEQKNRLRIEEKRGGDRCLWKEYTTLGGMQECKRYLEQCWGIK